MHLAIVLFVNVIYVPVLFVLMSRRRTIDYQAVFTYAINYILNNVRGKSCYFICEIRFRICIGGDAINYSCVGLSIINLRYIFF